MCVVNFCLQLLYRLTSNTVGFKMAAVSEPDVIKLPEHFHEAESHIDEFRPFMRRLQYLTPVRRDWLCANCHMLLLRAWKASCGHHFCGECVAYVILATQFSCPRDKKTIWDSEFCRSEEVETQVSRTFAICPFGCGSAYPAYELVKHKSSCWASSMFQKKSPLGLTSDSRIRRSDTKVDPVKSNGRDCDDDDGIKKIPLTTNNQDKEPVPVLGEEENNKMTENAELKKEIERLKKTLADTRITVWKMEDGYLTAIEQLHERVAVLEDQLGCVVASRLASTMSVDKSLVATKTKTAAIFESSQNYSWTISDIGKKLASADGTLVTESEEIFVDDGGLSMQVELCLKCLTSSSMAGGVVGNTCEGDSEENRSWRLVSSSLVIRALDSPLIESGRWPVKKHVQVELISPMLKRRCTAQGTHNFQRPSLAKHLFKFESFIDRKVFVEQILPQDFMTLQISFRDRNKDHKRHSISGGGGGSSNSFPF